MLSTKHRHLRFGFSAENQQKHFSISESKALFSVALALDTALSVVSLRQCSSVSICCFSVGSLQAAILEDLVTDVPLEFDFLFSRSHAEVISGKQEGEGTCILTMKVWQKVSVNLWFVTPPSVSLLPGCDDMILPMPTLKEFMPGLASTLCWAALITLRMVSVKV